MEEKFCFERFYLFDFIRPEFLHFRPELKTSLLDLLPKEINMQQVKKINIFFQEEK